MSHRKIIDVDFNDKKLNYNHLAAWRHALDEALIEKQYTLSAPEAFFINSPVDHSLNLLELNTKLEQLQPGEEIIMFRNMHYAIRFRQVSEEKLMLETYPLATGIDALLLENKFKEESVLIRKHANDLLSYFSVE